MTRHEGRARVQDGDIAYVVDGRGPPALLIQGVGVPGCGWAPQVDGLRARYALARYDHRGLGGSAAPTDALTIEQMAGDGLAVMDALGWDRAHVAGHSMGGLIAQALALSAPDRVSSLALLDTFARGAQAARLDWETFTFGLRMNVGTRAMRRRAAMRFVLPDDYIAARGESVLADELADVFGRDLADQPKVVMRQMAAMKRYDPSSRIAEIRHLPALVMTAEGDRIARPAFSHELAAAFGVDPVILPGSGHACTVQLADEVNALLAAHWESSGT